MQTDRKVVLTLGPVLLFILGGGVLFSWIIAPPENPEQFLWALPIGGTIGLLVCLYLHVVWDPKTLTSKGQYWGASGCLLPFAVIGGPICAKITSSFVPDDASQLLAASLMIAVCLMAIYMWVQVFRYRHYSQD